MEGGISSRIIAIGSAIKTKMFAMNVKDARRIRLGELKDTYGSLREIAALIYTHVSTSCNKPTARKKYSDRYLSQIHTGERNMGHSLASQIEGAIGKKEGWMDYVGASSSEVK